MNRKFVVYYRVSTAKQEYSGLGLKGQKQLVENYVLRVQGTIIAEFIEQASGGKDDRVKLAEALEFCIIHDATLLIATQSRLARSISTIQRLKESGVSWVCADMPQANELTVDIFAAVDEDHRRRISQNTKRALEAKKKTGWIPGTPANLTYAAKMAGVEARKKKAANNPKLKQLKSIIFDKVCLNKSLRQIAKELNDAGITSLTGKKFYPQTVRRLLN